MCKPGRRSLLVLFLLLTFVIVFLRIGRIKNRSHSLGWFACVVHCYWSVGSKTRTMIGQFCLCWALLLVSWIKNTDYDWTGLLVLCTGYKCNYFKLFLTVKSKQKYQLKFCPFAFITDLLPNSDLMACSKADDNEIPTNRILFSK